MGLRWWQSGVEPPFGCAQDKPQSKKATAPRSQNEHGAPGKPQSKKNEARTAQQRQITPENGHQKSRRVSQRRRGYVPHV